MMASKSAYQNDPIKQKARTAWKNMKSRCYNPQTRGFHRYGGRGIEVCDEWFDSFLPFYEWSLENGIAFGLTIDRIDNDGHYSPDNCRWVPPKVQSNNTCRNRVVEFNGEHKTVQQWSETLGLTSQAMDHRLSSDAWSLEEALTIGVGQKKVKQPLFRKRIFQVELDGKPIKEWESISDASASLCIPNSNISRALTNEKYSAGGFRWQYASEQRNQV